MPEPCVRVPRAGGLLLVSAAGSGEGMISSHLALEIAAARARGSSLGETESVPGCDCPTCTGVPADHLARVPAWRRRGPNRRNSESDRWIAGVEVARRVPILEIASRLGCGDPEKRGRDRVAVRCPLHRDRNPSLRIETDTGF